MIDISVVIPVYNGEALLKRCLDSVVGQKTKYAIEIIVVDDGSTDGTTKIVESYLNLNPNHNGKADANQSLSNHNSIGIRILQQKNGGPSKARNWGMKEAQGRYIALLDADDYWEDSYVEKTVQFLDENPECVAVNVVCLNKTVSGVSYTPDGFVNLNDDPNPAGDAKRSLSNLNPDPNANEKNKKSAKQNNKSEKAPFIIDKFYSFWAKWCHVGTCSTTMKAEVAKAVLMREDLRISEDYEFWLMVAGKGRWGMIPEALYVSDGTSAIDSQEAWINRMKRRWENAPALSEWEKRLVTQYPDLKQTEDFRWAEGRVSRNLTYCQLLSGRDQLARQEALKYGAYFVKDAIGKLMNLCKWSPITWKLLCKMLRYREYHRFEK